MQTLQFLDEVQLSQICTSQPHLSAFQTIPFHLANHLGRVCFQAQYIWIELHHVQSKDFL